MPNLSTTNLSNRIFELLNEARKKVAQAINHTMVLTYFEIGRMIVEKTVYGKNLILDLSQK